MDRRQMTFGPVLDHSFRRVVPFTIPFRFGPRHCGQAPSSLPDKGTARYSLLTICSPPEFSCRASWLKPMERFKAQYVIISSAFSLIFRKLFNLSLLHLSSILLFIGTVQNNPSKRAARGSSRRLDPVVGFQPFHPTEAGRWFHRLRYPSWSASQSQSFEGRAPNRTRIRCRL